MRSVIEYELQSSKNYLQWVFQELICSKFSTLKLDKVLKVRQIVAKRDMPVSPTLISKYGSYSMLIIANFLFGFICTYKRK